MTTKAAARLYEAQHVIEWNGKPCAVFNPLEKPTEELPVIYGFNNGGPSSLLHAVLIAEDGTELGSHACSTENYMPSDLGVLEGRHETFKAHYPDGYRMEFVGSSSIPGHDRLQSAFKLHREAKDADGSDAVH